MHKPRALALALVTILAGALLTGPAPSASGGEADRAAGGQQRFLLIQNDPNTESGGPIAANGSIHAHGTDVVLGPRKDRFEFPDGNIILRHKPKKGSSNDRYDPDTCLFTFTERGTWKVNEGSGDYEDAEGAGTYHVIGQGFTCDFENTPPKVFYVKITANGSLSY